MNKPSASSTRCKRICSKLNGLLGGVTGEDIRSISSVALAKLAEMDIRLGHLDVILGGTKSAISMYYELAESCTMLGKPIYLKFSFMTGTCKWKVSVVASIRDRVGVGVEPEHKSLVSKHDMAKIQAAFKK